MDRIVLMGIYLLELVKIYVVNQLLFEEKQNKKRVYVSLMTVSILMFCITLIRPMDLMAYGMAILGGWFFAQGNGKERLQKYVFVVALVVCMDTIPAILWEKAGIRTNWIDLMVSLTSLGIFSILFAVKKYISVKIHKVKNIVQLLIAILCISLGFGVEVIRDWISYLPDTIGVLNYDLMLIVTFISIILLAILSIYMEKTNQELEKSVEIEKELRVLQKKNSDLLLKKGEETKKYRHDMNHHLSCLYQIAQKENAPQTILYLEKMQQGLLAIQRMNYQTGLEILDILLNTLLIEVLDVEITVEGKIKGHINLDEVESCIVFSNLLQNALDELQRQKEGKKTLKIYVVQGRIYSRIQIINTVSEEKKKGEVTLETVKEDKANHGYGLKNVTAILDKKGGNIIFDIREGQFMAEVTIKNK